jgi:hypothetical protein
MSVSTWLAEVVRVTGGLARVLGAALVDADGADPEADGAALEA